jgi:hypothetical protein
MVTIKNILLEYFKFENSWIKFKLNQNLYGDDNILQDLPLTCNLIEFNFFDSNSVDLIFNYEGGSFNMNFENKMEFGKVENIIKEKLGLGDNVEFQDVGDRKICKFELVNELKIIKLASYDKFMKKELCKFIDLDLRLKIGKNKYDVIFKCFTGWNKFGVMSHIGKMFGLDNGYISFSLKENISAFKSINYYKETSRISGIYENDPRFILRRKCTQIDSLKNLELKQILIRTMDSYKLQTFYEKLSLRQLSQLIKYLYRADYITKGSEIMLERDDLLVAGLKNNCEFICHYWLKGGNPKRIGCSSSDDDEDNEEEEIYTEEEEEEVENIPENLEYYDLDFGNYIIDPEEWMMQLKKLNIKLGISSRNGGQLQSPDIIALKVNSKRLLKMLSVITLKEVLFIMMVWYATSEDGMGQRISVWVC